MHCHHFYMPLMVLEKVTLHVSQNKKKNEKANMKRTAALWLKTWLSTQSILYFDIKVQKSYTVQYSIII